MSGCEVKKMIDKHEQYANDVTEILYSQGLVADDETDSFKKYLRGW